PAHSPLPSFPTRRSSDLSRHLTTWPQADDGWRGDRRAIDLMATVLDHVRAQRTALRLGAGARISELVLHPTTDEAARLVDEIAEDRKSTRLNSSHVKISY